jgi:hypothetical protein
MVAMNAGKTTPGRTAARLRVIAYFRCVGLCDEAALEEASRAVLDRTESVWSADEPVEFEARAIALATDEVEQWLDDLAAQAPPEVADDVRGQLAWRVRESLKQHPEAFLKRNDLPEALGQAIRAAAIPIVPDRHSQAMAPQQFGELPFMLRARFWRGLVQWTGSAAQRLRAMIGGK